MTKVRSRSLATTAGRLVLAILGGAAMVGPFLWMVATSLTTQAQLGNVDAGLVPNPATLEPYQALGQTFPFWRFALNSLLIAVISTALQIFTSATAAYAFGRLRFRGATAVFLLYVATMMIPMQVIIVPLFIEMRTLRLVDTYAGLILPTIVSSFGVFMLRQAFLALPRELDEAAFVDGAGHFRVFWQILLPLVRPTLATFAVFAFMSSWNAFLWPLVIAQTQAHMTLPVGLSLLMGRYSPAWNVIMAGSALSALPILALYVFAQRYVVRGTAYSGIKA
jgi:multiple sugar transport system permease protein